MAHAIVSSVRAQEFADTMIRQHGCRYDNLIVIPLSQRELARRYSISPGTLAWYLDVLGDRVVARRPQLTFSVAASSDDGSISEDSRSAHTPPTSTLATVASDDVLRAIVDAIETSTRLLAELVEQIRATSSPELDSRVRANDPRERASQPRESLARSEEIKEERKEENILLPSSTRENGARVSFARSAPADSRERADYEDLLAPLALLARQRQLPTAGNKARLYLALDAHDRRAIEGAVTRLCDDIRRGTAIRSPFGLLLHKAEHHDLSYFAPLEPTGTAERPSSRAAADAEPPDELTALAEMALAEMDADPHRWATALADLESAVDAELRRQAPGHADRLLTMTPLRRAVRLDLYRARLADERSNA